MADESIIKVSIDGSGAKTGADEATDALNRTKAASDDLGTSLDKTQGVLTQSWDLGKFKTATDALTQMSAAGNSATTTLNTMVSALVQPWPVTGPNAVIAALQGMVQWTVNATTSVGNTISALASSWNTSGIQGAVNWLKSIVQYAVSATGAIQNTVSAVSSNWGSSAIQAVSSALSSVSNAAKSAASSVYAFATSGGAAASAVKELREGIDSLRKGFSSLTEAGGTLRNVLTVLIPVDLIAKGAGIFFEATNRLQGFLSTMTVVTGSVAASRKELGELFEIANKYGVNVTTLTDSFAKLAAAAKGTTLEGAGVRKAFEAITVASSAMHLSSEDTRLVLYALQQMVSKGTVSFEELRRQMAERFPGAMKIAAESMGMTDQAFQKLVKSGRLFTDDFLPAFSEGILAKFAPALAVSTNSLLAAVSRMQSAWEGFLMKMAESSLTQSVTRSLNIITEVINSIRPGVINALGDAIGHVVDYLGNFISALDEDKINRFLAGLGKFIMLLGDLLGILGQVIGYLAEKFEPEMKNAATIIDAFFNKDVSADTLVVSLGLLALGFKGTAAELIEAGKATTIYQRQQAETAEANAKTNQTLTDMAAGYSELGVPMHQFYEAQSTESTDFVADQKTKWDSWGDQVSRNIEAADRGLKALWRDAQNTKFVTYGLNDRGTGSSQTADPVLEANQKTKLEGLVGETAALQQNFMLKTKNNDATREFNELAKREIQLRLDLQTPDLSTSAKIRMQTELNGVLSKQAPLWNEMNQQMKAAAMVQDSTSNMMGRFVAMSKEATSSSTDLSDVIGEKLVPAEKEWIKLQESSAFKKKNELDQIRIKNAAEEAIALQKANKEWDDYINVLGEGAKALESLSEKDSKEADALKQKVIALNEGASASKGAAEAELDHLLATDKMQIAIAGLRLFYGPYIDDLLDSARANARAKDAMQATFEVTKKFTDESARTLKSIENETVKINEQAAELALTKEQKDLNAAATRELALAEVDHYIELTKLNERQGDEIEILTKRRQAIVDNIAAFRNLAQAQAAVDFQKNWVQAVDTISQKFSDFIKDGIESGWSAAFKKLWKDFLAWGIEAIAKLALQKIAISIFPQLASGFAQGNNGPFGVWGNLFGNVLGGSGSTAGSSSGASNDSQYGMNDRGTGTSDSVGNVTSMASTFSTGYTLYDKLGNFFNGGKGGFNGISNFFGNMVGNSAVTQNAAGVGTLDNFAPSVMGDQSAYGLSGFTNPVGMFQTGGTGFLGVGNAGLTLGNAAAGAGIGYVLSSLFAKYFGNERNQTGIQVGGTIGGTAGMIVGGPIGAVIGTMIGSAIGSLFKSGGGPKQQGAGGAVFNKAGDYVKPVDNGPDLVGITGDNQNKSQADEFAKTLGTTFFDALKSFGGTPGAMNFGVGFSVDSKGTAPSFVHTTVQDDQGNTIFKQNNDSVGRTDEELQAEIKIQSSRAILAALQSSDLPEFLTKWMKSISAVDATQEQIDHVLGVGQALKVAVDTIPALGDQFAAMDPAQIDGLVEAMGGMANFLASQQYLQANFTTHSDQVAASTQRLDKVFGDLGISVPKTHDEFLSVLSSFDLTTEAGRSAYAAVMGVSDAFVTIHGTAEAAAAALNQAAQTGQQAFDEKFLTPAEKKQNRIDNDLAQLATGAGKIDNVLKDMNLTTIPTSIDGFKKFVLAVKAKYGADSDEYKQVIALTPVILDLNDAYGVQIDVAGDAADAVKQVTVSFGDLVDQGKAQANRIIDQAKILADASHGDFGSKLAMQIDLINSQIALLPDNVLHGGGDAVQKAYLGTLKASSDALSAQLQLFTSLSQRYDAARAEQLVTLQKWFDDNLKVFGGAGIGAKLSSYTNLRDSFQSQIDSAAPGTDTSALQAFVSHYNDLIADTLASASPGVQALYASFQEQWDAIINGSADAAQSLDEFIKKIQEIADATGGDVGQQASLELALSKPKLAEMQTSYAGMDPASAAAKLLATQIDQLTTYNEGLNVQVQHFAEYTQQYGAEAAGQLVDLEKNYEEWKASVGDNTEALGILQLIFDDKWAKIIASAADGAAALDALVKSIQDLAQGAGGDAGQQARLQIAYVNAKYAELAASYSQLDPSSSAAGAIYTQILALGDYNEQLKTQLAHFVDYKRQYGVTIANQLVELEINYEEQKKAANGNVDALAVLAEIFQDHWKAIIDGVSGTADELEKLRQSIRDFLDGLKTSDLSPLSPMQKLQESKNQYQDTLAKAQSGDLTALADITKDAQEYLTLAHTAYASSQTYHDIFDSVVNALATLSNYTSAPPTTSVPTTAAPPTVINSPPVVNILTSTAPATSPVTAPQATTLPVQPAGVTNYPVPTVSVTPTASAELVQTSQTVQTPTVSQDGLQAVATGVGAMVDAVSSVPDYTDHFVAIETRLDDLISMEKIEIAPIVSGQNLNFVTNSLDQSSTVSNASNDLNSASTATDLSNSADTTNHVLSSVNTALDQSRSTLTDVQSSYVTNPTVDQSVTNQSASSVNSSLSSPTSVTNDMASVSNALQTSLNTTGDTVSNLTDSSSTVSQISGAKQWITNLMNSVQAGNISNLASNTIGPVTNQVSNLSSVGGSSSSSVDNRYFETKVPPDFSAQFDQLSKVPNYSAQFQPIESKVTQLIDLEAAKDYTAVLNTIASKLPLNSSAPDSEESTGTQATFVTAPVLHAVQSASAATSDKLDGVLPTDGTPMVSSGDIKDMKLTLEAILIAMAQAASKDAKGTQDWLRRATEVAARQKAALK